MKITGKSGDDDDDDDDNDNDNDNDDEVRISKIRRLRKGERTRDTIKRVLTIASFDRTRTTDIFQDARRIPTCFVTFAPNYKYLLLYNL